MVLIIGFWELEARVRNSVRVEVDLSGMHSVEKGQRSTAGCQELAMPAENVGTRGA